MMTKDRFVSQAVVELLQHGISIDLTQTELLSSGFAGEFGTSPRQISVAMRGSFGFETFVHEYCHFRQSIEDPRLWKTAEYAAYEYFHWLKRPTKRAPHEALAAILKVEHDCEVRTIQMIRDYKLPIRIRRNTQSANMYLYSYTAAAHFGVWPDVPKDTTQTFQSMPTKLRDVDHYLNLDNIPPLLLRRFQNG